MEAASEGMASAQEWFITRERLEPDAVWVLSHLLCARPQPALEAKLAKIREELRGKAPWGRILDPEQPRPLVSTSILERERGLIHYIVASIGRPRDRALRLLREYLAMEAQGYELTHQLLVLVWWEEGDRVLPPDLQALRPKIQRRIREEHARGSAFSDLYAERAMLLAHFGSRPCPAELPAWVDVILEAQDGSGGWVDPRDLRKARSPSALVPSAHTSVLALSVLQAYVDCMDPHPEARGAFVPWRGLCGGEGPFAREAQ
ncbi:MAG: hypothetical protein ACODAU_09505 [Myxococcota bacterium]